MRCHLMPLLSGTLLLLAAALPAAGAGPSDPLAGLPAGDPVIGPQGVEAFALGGRGARREAAELSGRGFSNAVRIVTAERPERPWGIQLGTTNRAAVARGDILLAGFWVRAIDPLPESGEAAAEFCVETRGEPWTKSVLYPVTVTRAWQRHFTAFRAAGDFAPGAASINFRLGYEPQTVEIADLVLVNYRARVRMDDLPFTPITYGGREADAPWRAEAARRIEEFRKADLAVAVRDASGRPVAGALVRVCMKRHAFGFGTAVNARPLLAQGPDADRYREVLRTSYNKAVLENELKWDFWDHNENSGTRALAWLEQHGLPTRGHCLVWPKPVHLPRRAVALMGDPPALREAVNGHIREIVGRFRGRLPEWDVVNEPYDCYHVQNVLAGRGADAARLPPEESARQAAEWFRIAHEADPAARLYANDYEILSGSGRDHAHQDYYERFVRALVREGAPIHGIGLQGHFREPTPIPRILALLDRFAAIGLDLQITEHDLNTWDADYQADFTRDFMTAAFSHPAVTGFMIWGFWERAHWLPDAAHYAGDWTLRPAGRAWRDLVFGAWWTTAEGRTGTDGVYRTRGFLGDYEIAVETDAGRTTSEAHLDRGGARIDARLPSPSSPES